ncbi:hypothetical protein BVI434_1290015 [Burkholderia vietnamiensis]|nr:hypothetical protein BVI434_1290015 [Burkholderia vietnamiensis]CAG9230658.1 hypothetical protein BVI1335_750010 [Burkholderia vietnamiensis]
MIFVSSSSTAIEIDGGMHIHHY